MMKKIAIPVDENDVLAQHMGHSKVFDIYDVEGTEVTRIVQLAAPPHQPGILPKWLIEQGVTDVLTGGAGQKAIDLLNEGGVDVHVGTPVATSAELVTQFINETLQFTGNGCSH
ncbi:ATPase [Prolixibacteraceae bacterium JC049]|nr:ATPase [Prolixibacteraceae bacterium JC049]